MFRVLTLLTPLLLLVGSDRTWQAHNASYSHLTSTPIARVWGVSD
jgi:hypothetical protein